MEKLGNIFWGGILLPASISASDPPQTEAIEDEPFDSKTSEVNLIVNG